MCFSSTSQQQQQSSTNSQNTLDPYLYKAGKTLTNDTGSYLQSNPYQGYTGSTTGAFGSTFGTAQNDATSRAGTTDQNFANAGNNFQTGTGIAAQTAATPISQLMSQYTQAALNPTLDAIQRQSAQNNSGIAQNATMAGAFGDTGYGTQRATNDYNTTNAVAGATANAYNTAYNNAYSTQQSALQNLFSGASGQSGLGTAQTGAATNLDALLANMGSTQQQANQTGINTAINVNNQNQMGQLQQNALGAGIMNTAPHDTYSSNQGNTTGTTTTPDNSGIGALGSLFGGFL